MNMRSIKPLLLSGLLLTSPALLADDYKIDTKGAHASIQFKIKHLGYSWLTGRFNTFSGKFSYDENDLSASKVRVLIDTTSIDTNHAERDKHLRSKDFLDTAKYPQATFKSISFSDKGDGKAVLVGDLTLHGVTKSVTLDVVGIGHGNDPWGGYRRGFEGKTTIALKDFGIDINNNLGPASTHVELTLNVEGIKIK
ncbi:YceI family protein [Sinobacterium caligoides]